MNHIVFCLDDNYAPLLGIAMSSILKHSSADYCFWIMHNSLSEKNQVKIQKIADKFKSKLFFIPVDETKELLEFKKPKIWANKVCYYRMLAPYKVKKEAQKKGIKVNKFLFIDCDILVLKDLNPLFQIDMANKTLAAVASPLYEDERLYIPTLKLSKTHRYLHAGLMLIDCDKWQENNIYNKAVEIDQKHPEGLKWNDMDILNIIFQDDYTLLPPKYSIWPGLNFEPYILNYDSLCKAYQGIYEKTYIEEALYHPVLLQLAGGAKPWRDDCCPIRVVWTWFINSLGTPYRKDGWGYLKNKLKSVYDKHKR